MISTGNHTEDVAKYAAEYKAYFDRNQEGGLTCLDQAPRWALWANKGRFVFGPNGKRLRVISDLIDHTSKCIQWGEYLGGWKALSEKEIFDLEYWELEQAKLKRKRRRGHWKVKWRLYRALHLGWSGNRGRVASPRCLCCWSRHLPHHSQNCLTAILLTWGLL